MDAGKQAVKAAVCRNGRLIKCVLLSGLRLLAVPDGFSCSGDVREERRIMTMRETLIRSRRGRWKRRRRSDACEDPEQQVSGKDQNQEELSRFTIY